MIKIQLEKNKKIEIENSHWSWFKSNILKNWINKMNKNNQFIEIFFKDRVSFEKWFNIKKYQSTKDWVEKQGDKKFKVFEEFIKGDIERLNNIKNRLGIIKGKDNNIKEYFEGQYNLFRGSKNGWGGAELIYELNISVCPYCNRSFIDTYIYNKENLKSNAQLDHFYPKEKYPYLALSLYNLIPSCFKCNHVKSSHDKDFIYPYEEGFGEIAKFKTDFYTDKDIKKIVSNEKIEEKDKYDISYLLGNSDNFKIQIKLTNTKCKKSERVKNAIKTFQFKELYNFHKDYVRELIKKSIIYNESRLDELYSQYSDLFKSREEVLQVIFSNYTCEEDLGKRPLAKLTKDICDELGIKTEL